MKFKMIGLLVALLSFVTSAQAGEYECKVYCNGGSIYVTVNADSKSDAAQKIDPTPVANQICNDAGKGNASSSSMSSNQCSAK